MRFLLPLTAVVGTCLSACVMSGTQRTTETTGVARTAEQSILAGLAVFSGVGQTRVSPEGALADLQDHEDVGDVKEREMIAALLPLLTKVAEESEALSPDDHRTVYDVMARMAERRPLDFEIQYAMVAGMSAIESLLNAAAAEPPATGESRAKDLATRFPLQPRAHAHLGRTVTTSDPLLAMQSFARCLQLDPVDPAMAGCKTGLTAVAGRYQEPRCTKVAAKRLELHAAYAPNAQTAKAGRKGLKPIKIGKRLLLMENKAALNGLAVEEAQASDGDKHILLTLTPKAAGTLAEITGQLAERQGFLVLMVDGKVDSAPQVMSAIESGTIHLTGISLNKLCGKVEKRELPAEVVGLLGGS